MWRRGRSTMLLRPARSCTPNYRSGERGLFDLAPTRSEPRHGRPATYSAWDYESPSRPAASSDQNATHLALPETGACGSLGAGSGCQLQVDPRRPAGSCSTSFSPVPAVGNRKDPNPDPPGVNYGAISHGARAPS